MRKYLPPRGTGYRGASKARDGAPAAPSGSAGVGRAVCEDEIRMREAEAWERGHFYCAAAAAGHHCVNPYLPPPLLVRPTPTHTDTESESA